LSSYSNV